VDTRDHASICFFGESDRGLAVSTHVGNLQGQQRLDPVVNPVQTVCLASVAAMSNDLPELRASHEDRNRVVDALRVAGGDGRLSAEELDARLESALNSRTLGELAGLTEDLPVAPAAKEVLVVEQHGGKYVQEGRWQVPARIDLRTRECRVVLDFSHAVVTSNVVRIETDMVHGKLFIVGAPDIVIDTDGLALTYSKLKLRSTNAAAEPRLRIELVGKLIHAKVIEQRR
jgi:sugar phosphate isomerase/epimerase